MIKETIVFILIYQLIVMMILVTNLQKYVISEMQNILNEKDSEGKNFLGLLVYLIIPSIFCSLAYGVIGIIIIFTTTTIYTIKYIDYTNSKNKRLQEYELKVIRYAIKSWLKKYKPELQFDYIEQGLRICDVTTRKQRIYTIEKFNYTTNKNKIERFYILWNFKKFISKTFKTNDEKYKSKIIKILERI